MNCSKRNLTPTKGNPAYALPLTDRELEIMEKVLSKREEYLKHEYSQYPNLIRGALDDISHLLNKVTWARNELFLKGVKEKYD